MYALCPKMTLQVLVQNAATCVSAVGKAGGKAAFNATALGASRRGLVSRDRKPLVNSPPEMCLDVLCVSPSVASIAPPPSITRHVTWTSTPTVFAPTKAGKLWRPRKGGGGDENDDPAIPGNDGNRHEFLDEHDLDDGNGSGDGMDGGSGDEWFGRDGWNGGGGGDGDVNRWIDGEYARNDGRLMWAWHTVCGVALVGSVQHAVGAAVAGSKASSAVISVATTAADENLTAFEAVASARAGARFASITSAHLSRQQPKLSMST